MLNIENRLGPSRLSVKTVSRPPL